MAEGIYDASQEPPASQATNRKVADAARFKLPLRSITLATRFTEDLAMDSITAVELLMELEDRYGVTVTDEEAAHLDTVSDLVALIADRAEG
jgi:acyl carrier protein